MTTTLVRPSTPRLSEAARHLVIPSGIERSVWPRVERRLSTVGVEFDLWQQGLASVALGCRADGTYAATVGGIVASIPRQVGKTFTVGHLLVGLAIEFPGLRIVWTSHHGRTTTNTFRSMQGMVRRKAIRPHLAHGRSEGIRTANGEQEIAFRNESLIMFGAREHGFGRGMDAIDVIVFDEAQILGTKALEDMVPSTNQSRHPHGALIFFIGTPPRPEDDGEAFALKRTTSLEGRATDQLYVEMSADPDGDPDDQVQWSKANPSFPIRTPEASMLRMRANLGSDESWTREALGVWVPVGAQQVIDPDTWRRQADPASMAIERLSLGIDVAPDRSKSAVSLAGRRFDERWHVELDEHRTGTDWIAPWVESRCKANAIHAVVVDELSGMVEKRRGQHYLIGTDIVVTLAASEGRDMAVACAKYYDGVVAGTVVHTDQPQVNQALAQASKRRLGAGWAWNRRGSESDITPITSETLALWGAQSNNPKRPGRPGRAGRREAVVM